MSTTTEAFEPKIIGFLCNWCSYRAADLAGSSRIKHAPNVRIVRLMCSGRVEPHLVLKALSGGADGVLIAGCHPGECHYVDQNHKTRRRVAMIKHTLTGLGVDARRVRLQWASAAEGPQIAAAIDEMVAELRELGPLKWPASWQAADEGDSATVADVVAEHAQSETEANA